MSKDVDRNQVLRTTRVRTLLKNDGSWIHRSKPEEGEQSGARADQAAAPSPAPARQKSYVFSTAKKFGSVESPPNPPLQNTQLSPSTGDSANQANGEVVLPHKDAQPEGATVQSEDDTKPKTHTEEIIQNSDAQPEKVCASTAAENKEEHADSPVGQSNVEHSERAAEVCADACVEECIQNGGAHIVPSTKENPEEVSPVEPAEPQVANTAAENKGECVNTQQSEAEDSADAPLEDPVVQTSDVTGTGESKDPAEAPAVLSVEPASQEGTEPANAKHLEDVAGESVVQPVEGSTDKCDPEQSRKEIVEAVAEVVMDSSPEIPAVNNATPGEEAAGELTLDTVTEPTTHSSAEITVEFKDESAAPAEPVLKTTAEEVVECEVQPLNNTVVEQSAEPAPDNAAGRVMELSIKDAHEPVNAAEAGANQGKLSDRAIELTDALDLEPPTADADPKPVEDPKPSHSEESKLNQPDDTNTTETFPKPREELRSTYTLKETRDGEAVCSFCDQVIGNVKITLSEPPVTCHGDCLKCGVCGKALGDMLTPMFLHDQVIHCGDCFAKALKT